MGKQNKQTNLTMKFAAALLFATATAGYAGYGKGEQVAVAGYEAPETQLLNWTKSYTSDYKKIDVDAIVTELHRNAMDELIAVFEADILGLREAIQASRDAKRAEIADANAQMRATQDALVADIVTTLAELNDNQEHL